MGLHWSHEGTRSSSNTQPLLQHLLYVLSSAEMMTTTWGYSQPLAFTPLKGCLLHIVWWQASRGLCYECYTITEHILPFKCWLPADSQSDSYANESTVTGVITPLWLFRELTVKHNDAIQWLWERQCEREVRAAGRQVESWAWRCTIKASPTKFTLTIATLSESPYRKFLYQSFQGQARINLIFLMLSQRRCFILYDDMIGGCNSVERK